MRYPALALVPPFYQPQEYGVLDSARYYYQDFLSRKGSDLSLFEESRVEMNLALLEVEMGNFEGSGGSEGQ